MKFSEEQACARFLTTKEWRNFRTVKSRTIWQTKNIQIKLITTYNKNKQKDAKNNTELLTKLTKTTWKTFEETIRRGPKQVY